MTASAEPDETFRPGTWDYYRRVLLAPACLCLVAGLHVYRVNVHDQSPWKGGGFGMFSTVDSPPARYLKVYLLTDEGEIPVELPDRLSKRAAELCTAPNEEKLDYLTEQAAGLSWKSDRRYWQKVATQFNVLRAGERPIDRRYVEPPQIMSVRFEPRRPGEKSAVVAAGRDMSLNAGDEFVSYHAVRIELWRLAFESDQKQVHGTRSLSCTKSRTEPSE